MKTMSQKQNKLAQKDPMIIYKKERELSLKWILRSKQTTE